MKIKRALAYPLAIGSQVRLIGRVKECADLVDAGERILDVGCSSGWLAPLVLSKGYRAYIGLDRTIVGRDKPRAPANFVEGSVFALPFDRESFDAVCLFDVIEHLPRGTEQSGLREVHRVLAPGGRLYLSTPHASPLHSPLDPVWIVGHRHYKRATIRRLIASAGFTVERIFVAGGFVECLDHVRLLTYKHLLHRAHPTVAAIDRMIERSHGHDRRIGMTVFAVAQRPIGGSSG